MIFGYYLAARRLRRGDPQLARLARLIWRSRGHRHPARYDGVSLWLTSEGIEARIIARDLFSEAVASFPPHAPFPVPRIRVGVL